MYILESKQDISLIYVDFYPRQRTRVILNNNHIFDRCKDFAFEKTKANPSDKQHSAATNLQAVYLKKLLEEKEKEIKSLQNQLHKANNENVKLIQELEG